MNHYVYEITNLINGKKYIGKRSCHCPIEEDKYMGSGLSIKKAISKYGIDNFKKIIIKTFSSSDEAYRFEENIIEQLNAYKDPMYYNISGGGKGAGVGESHPNFNRVFSYETRQKLSASLIGKPKPMSQRMKLSEYHKGKPLKESTKEKLREHFSERYKGDGNPFFGKKHSEETKEKLRQLNIGKKYSDDTKRKQSLKRTGELNGMYGKKGKESPNSIKIICLTTNKIFDCIREGAEEYNLDPSSLAKCCKGNLKSCGKIEGKPMVWMYYDDYLKLSNDEIEQIRLYSNKCYVKVINLNTLKVFNTLTEGALFSNTTKHSIFKCCKGNLKSAGKINGEPARWMYYEDYLNIKNERS